MKMIYCTYNVSVQEEMEKILNRTSVKNYQIFDNILAKAEGAQPRFNTPVWPGYNQVALIQMDDSSPLIEEIKIYNTNEKDINDQILAYTWDVERPAD